MKFKNKIITLLMLIIAMITAITSSSHAFSGFDSHSVGQVVTGGYNDLMQSNNYCIQYGAPLYGGEYSFRVEDYIKIEGTTLYINGNKINSKKENAILAYIIGANYDNYNYSYSGENYTLRQKLLWAYWNDWSTSAGKSWNYGGNDYWTEYKNNKVMKDAQEYANNVGSGIKADVKITNKTVESQGTYDGGEKIGTFSITYTGNIKSLTVKDSNGNEIKSGITFYQNGKEVNKLNIQSGKDFYIINKSGKQAKNIDVKVTTKSETVIVAELWRLNSLSGMQNIIYAKHSEKTNSSEDGLNINIKRQEEGNIILHKKDSSTGKELQGAKFKVYIEGKGWLAIDNTGAYKYNATQATAKEFGTGKDGKIVINNLKNGLKIRIFEVKAPEGYKLEDQYGYDKTQDRVWCNRAIYTVTTKTTDDTIEMKNSKTGNLEIIKKDKTTAQKLSGAEFKISVNSEGKKNSNTWLKKNNDGTYNYTSSFNDATAFKTTDGKVKIEELDTKKYFVYEVKAPTGYNLADQDDYDATNDWVKCGNAQVVSGNTVTVNQNNTRLVAIEGYVWIEKPGSKANEYNDIYDNGEEIITNNVKITLRNKSNNGIVAENPIIKTENGKAIYRFEKVDFYRLSEYYVHFDYSEKYKKYITVSARFDIPEGSKAISDNVPEADRELSGRANTYKGTSDEAKYGLLGLANKFYDAKTYTLKNINLGIKELPNTPFTVSENLAYVDMKIKGYNYRYIYGGTGEKVQTVPTIQWQSKTDKESYTRDIYPSDVLYENTADKTQELQVYATYRVDVTNNTKIDVPYLYQEKYLNVTKVLNKYDTSRYELADSNWEVTNDNSIAQMKNEYLQKQYYDANRNGISNEDEKNNKYAYITFKIKKEALTEMLKSQFGTIEEFPTEAIVTAYHRYTRIDYSWANNLTKTQTHNTDETTQNDKAPYLNTIPGNNRTISGKVFEDINARNNGELVGNGLYDQNENKVQGVTVELGNYDSDGNFVPTDLYVKNENGTTKFDSEGKLPKATMKSTEKEGTYKFEGVVPGEYILRYTYGDGTQKIVDQNGKEIDVLSNKYKSTIVTDEIRRAFETNYEPTKATWYLGIGENNNIALDDLKLRAELSKDLYEVKAGDPSNKESKNMIASTREFSIPVEFKDNNEASVTEQFPSELGYMDFGIIEMPKIRLDIKKKITNVKLTLQNGQVLLEGNPATQNIAYTTDLDKKTEGGSTYVKMEMDSNNIYGGTLEIKYEIEVVNNSDLDYIGDNYYKYGDKTNATEKTVEVKEVYDYLDPKVSYKSKEGTQKVETIEIQSFRNQDADKLSKDQKAILSLVKDVESEYSKQFDTILKIEDFGRLYSIKGANKDNSSSKITINAEKILSSNDDDLEFINIAEIIKVKNDEKSITPANVELPEAEKTNTEIGIKIGKTPNVTLTVTPSTGADRSMIYFIAGAIALVIFAGGIALIRKNSKK